MSRLPERNRDISNLEARMPTVTTATDERPLHTEQAVAVSAATTSVHRVEVDGVRLFYRRAGMTNEAVPMVPTPTSATPAARKDESNGLVVLVSGVFHAAYRHELPAFERETGAKVTSELSPSLGDSPQSVESRLARGEDADVLIMAGRGLDQVVAKGLVAEGTRVELARAPMGLAMKEGAPKPDISTPDRLRQTLLSASSVGYSISASGQYVSHELFKKLGIQEQMRRKAREVKGVTPVAETVAKGENQYGFQAVSELLPVKGIELIGKLPGTFEFVTPVSAAVALESKNPEGARSLLRFLTRPEMGSILERHGLDRVPA